MYARLEEREKIPAWKAVLLVFLPSLITFIVLDMVWLGLVAKDMYQKYLSAILRPQVDVAAGLLAWAAIVGLVQLFALPRAHSLQQAALSGAVLGLLLYATVDLTNTATLAAWPWVLSLVDICWGTTACCICGIVQFKLYGLSERS